MTPRSIRRAAERKANKLARKAAAANPELPTPDSTQAPTREINPNPATPFIPSPELANAHLTAVRSTLTGHTTLLSKVDAAPYAQILTDYQNELQPIGLRESNLVQILAESIWRTRGLFALETAIFAKGRIEFAEQFAEHKPELRDSLIDVHTFLVYEKQIRGLQQQEARLFRRYEKASAELRAVQQERRELERAVQFKPHTAHPKPVPAQNGFEFSNRESEARPPQTPKSQTHVNPVQNAASRSTAPGSSAHGEAA